MHEPLSECRDHLPFMLKKLTKQSTQRAQIFNHVEFISMMGFHNRKFIGDSSREDEFGFRVNIDRLLTRVGKLNK